MEHSKDADLIEAIRNKNLEKTLQCLSTGADPDALDGDTPLIVVSMVQGCEEPALALIDAGCRVNLTTIRKGRGMQHGMSLPCMAYRIGMHRVLKRLLHHPCCDFSQTDDSENNTIMHLAVRGGDITLVDALLSKGLLLMSNRQGFTPLHLAARSGNVELMHTFFNQWRRANGVMAACHEHTAGLDAVDNEVGVPQANTDSKALAQPLSNTLHTPNPGQAVTGVSPAKAERKYSFLDTAFPYMATPHRDNSVPTAEAFRTETRTSDSLPLTFSHHKQKTNRTVAGKVLDSCQPKDKQNSSSSETLNAEAKDGLLQSFTLAEEMEACLISMPAEQVCETWTQWRQAGAGCCRKFVEHTATHTGNTMLHQAAKGAHVKLLKYLLAHGADVNSLSRRNKTPLMCLVSDAGLTSQAEETARDLIDAGCDVNLLGPCSELRHNSCHTSAVRVAAGRNSIRMVDLLVEAGASLSASSQALDCGDTALIAALKQNACEVAWHLLTHYPHHLHHNHADREGNTALHLVIGLERRRKAITNILLKLGADFFGENRSGQSPVALAVRRNGAEAMEMFLQHKPGLLFRPSAGQFSWTCMLSHCGHFPHQSKGKLLQVLLRYGADVNQVQPDGRTVLEGLLACGCIDGAFFLTQLGCRVRDNSVTRSFQRFHSGETRQHSGDTIRKQSPVSEETGHLQQDETEGDVSQGDREVDIANSYSQTNTLSSLPPSLTCEQRTVREGDNANSYSQTQTVSSFPRPLPSEQGELSVEGKVQAIVSYIARYLHEPCSLQSLCLDAIRQQVRRHRSDFSDAARLPLPQSIINVILYTC